MNKYVTDSLLHDFEKKDRDWFAKNHIRFYSYRYDFPYRITHIERYDHENNFLVEAKDEDESTSFFVLSGLRGVDWVK